VFLVLKSFFLHYLKILLSSNSRIRLANPGEFSQRAFLNGKIDEGIIKNLFTTIRNDNKKIDISFKIPDRVLTGSKYDIDIILNKPLEEVIIAGAIKPHQVNSFFEQEILLEPLASGGIFKITRAPSKPGIQIWSGIIAHPEGMITFTKSIDIVDEI